MLPAACPASCLCVVCFVSAALLRTTAVRVPRAMHANRQVQISENAIVKVDELQKPIVGGSWTTKTDFGRLEIKIIPCWTGKGPFFVLFFG